MTLLAPAKVNWYLQVLGKRADGYHDLETLFVRVNLCDRVTLKDHPSQIRIVTSAPIPKGPGNLAYRAADLLRQEFGITRGVTIHLQKKIPMAAGLGGGSSDAASVLLGLNRLWKIGCSTKRLSELGGQIGSDVPFFVSETDYAVGRGRGEKIQPVHSKRRVWHVLVKPSFGISTGEAYEEYARLARLQPRFLTPPKGGAKILLRFLQGRSSSAPQDGFFNSLEVALNKRDTTINDLKNSLLKKGAMGALLSGSGSTVFGVFLKKEDALKASRGFQKSNCEVFVI